MGTEAIRELANMMLEAPDEVVSSAAKRALAEASDHDHALRDARNAVLEFCALGAELRGLPDFALAIRKFKEPQAPAPAASP